MELFIYLLKSSGCMAVFYLVYYAMFRKLTFFTLNRWYLLASLVLSLVIPLLHIDVQTKVFTPDLKPVTINTTAKTIADVNETLIISQQSQKPVNWLHLANVLYFIIVGIILLKLLISLGGIVYRAIKHGKKQNGYRLINSSSGNNSSFFNLIFLNCNGLDNAEREQVITHELVHARLLHSADNLFSEALKALFWFNPFIYLYSKALHQAHEFEVDRHLALQYNSKNYAQLLLKLSNPAALSISNQFSAYGLKSRVQMLFSSPSAAAKKLAYLFMFPVVAVLVYFLAINKVYAFTDNTRADNKNFVLVLDAGHGGKASGAISDGIDEKNLTLLIVSEIKFVADARGIKTVLTRSDDSDVSLAQRAATNGDIFVSIHSNMVQAKYSDKSGIVIFTSNKNKAFQQSQILAQEFSKQFEQLSGLNTINLESSQNIFVLRESKLPAVLLELGYMTNKKDMKYLLDKKYRLELANKFIDAVIAYKNSAQPKLSGAVVVPDTGLKVKVSLNFTPAKSDKTSALADTAIKSKNKATAAIKTLPIKGKVTSMKISYSEDDDTNADKDGNLSDEFKNIRYTASDSTKFDAHNKLLYLYGRQTTLISRKFNISANVIRYSLKDSVVIANGDVHVKVRDDVKKPFTTTMNTDSLVIDLKNHPKTKPVN